MSIREAKKLMAMYPPFIVLPQDMVSTCEEQIRAMEVVGEWYKTNFPKARFKMLMFVSKDVDEPEIRFPSVARRAIERLKINLPV